MEEQYEVQEAHDPTLSSRAKDALFADPPREPMDDAQRELEKHKAAVKRNENGDTRDLSDSASRARAKEGQPAEGMLAQPVPERHDSGGPYEEEASDATVDDADFDAPEQNRKDGSA